MMGITKKQFFSYSALPGLRPRIRDILLSGFQYIPFFMAMVYQAVRLLPATHPYCQSSNIGKFGIRHVIAEAANNLVLSWKNLDQIALFASLLIGIVIALLEITLAVISLFGGPAMAAMPTSFAGFFLTPASTQAQDLAGMMLDLVFGVPGIFKSCVDPGVGSVCKDANGVAIAETDTSGAQHGNWILGGTMNDLKWPYPIHEGLHQMFQTYSIGLLVVATLITIYFITTIIIETAESGTAFGKRFNRVWAPVRIVVAFGLLVPVGYGLNSSQYIVLYAAKFGSGFATNGWNLFNGSLTGSYVGQVNNLVSENTPPEVNGLLQFMYTANVCYYLEDIKSNVHPQMYVVKDNMAADPFLLVEDATYDPAATTTTYETLINFLNGDKQAVIRFGLQDDKLYGKEMGHVSPVCGELILPLTDPRKLTGDNRAERSAVVMQAYYFALIREMWYTTFDGSPPADTPLATWTQKYTYNTAQRYTQWEQDPNVQLPLPEYKKALQDFYAQDLEAVIKTPTARVIALDPAIGADGAMKEAINSTRWTVTDDLKQKGWAGAGIWYNKIAELNGAVSASVLNIPIPSRYPAVMEYVSQKKKQQDSNVSSAERFNPVLAGNQDVAGLRPQDAQMASALWEAYRYWQADGQATTTRTSVTGNPIIDFINQIFGTSGLYSIRKNPGVHPLAQLVGVGRSLMDAGTRNVFSASMAAILGAMLDKGGAGKALSQAAISMLMTIATVALTAGFTLFYVIPFLPFIYFFFAVSGWVKAIFEAMVGAPLWALAHIRIDGNGLPGQAAVNGYFLIFEIFLRPILIIFGLLASISIFAATVAVLNDTWDLVTANLSGFDEQTEIASGGGIGSLLDFMRGPVDEFFFTIVYTIIVYMMALSSFKLIDQIPGNIMRWMGQALVTFNDSRENAGEAFLASAGIGSQQAIQGIGGGLQGGMGAINSIDLNK